MQQIVMNDIPKGKLAAFGRELDAILLKIHENTIAAKLTYKEIDRLKKSNDRSFERMKRAVEKLETY